MLSHVTCSWSTESMSSPAQQKQSLSPDQISVYHPCHRHHGPTLPLPACPSEPGSPHRPRPRPRPPTSPRYHFKSLLSPPNTTRRRQFVIHPHPPITSQISPPLPLAPARAAADVVVGALRSPGKTLAPSPPGRPAGPRSAALSWPSSL